MALITYPAVQENGDIQRFLRREISLPNDMVGEPEFRAVQADAMVVVLTRSSMGITEVPELRRVIKLWADAQRNPLPHDTLGWRQRLIRDDGYLIMDQRDRRQVLHRLLCAAWNGKVAIAGEPTSPDHIIVKIGSQEAVSMKLELTRLGDLSSWASVLQAYEDWILSDDSPVRRNLAGRLMVSMPTDADRSPAPPAPEFAAIVDLAESESKKVVAAERNRVLGQDPQLAVFREFWSQALPSALRQQIGNTRKCLLDLREQVGDADGADSL